MTVVVLIGALARRLGLGTAVLGGIAFGACGLVLYYGRLAYLEPVIALALTCGALTALRATDPTAGRWGIVGGVLMATAIATKVSAVFAVAGILLAVALEARSPSVRRWLGAAIAAIALVGLGWLLFVFLPNQNAIHVDLAIWPQETLPSSLGALSKRVLDYFSRSDGALTLAAPALAAAFVGGLILLLRWRHLDAVTRRLGLLAAGWLIVGFAVLLVVPYRPNRYVLPLLPAAAILVAVGSSALRPSAARWMRAARLTAAAAVLVVLAVPGLVSYAGWVGQTASTLPDAEAAIARLIPPGSTVQGETAPTLAMQARAVTLVSRPSTGVNMGDLYVNRGVRWVIATPGGDDIPGWAGAHEVAWASREAVFCFEWPDSVCLYRLP